MKRESRTLINEEMPFDISEIFFSTTDRKGMISGCNDVFLRVSVYEPHELLGEPHNVIRHPDMPRCVFALLWEYLLGGKSIGAYVKNLAKNGKYYWVFALASPCGEGFISVRIKPTSSTFELVKKLYLELLALEKSFGGDWRRGMEASKELLLQRLAELGFDSYDEFMSASLRQEMMQRNDAMSARGAISTGDNQTLNALMRVFNDLDRLMALRRSLREKEGHFLSLGANMSRVAINASVRAAHLADAGKSLGVISEEISQVSRAIGKESEELKGSSGALATSLGQISFHVAQAILQSQAIAFFESEQQMNSLGLTEQRNRFGKEIAELNSLLKSCIGHSLRSCVEGVTVLRQAFRTFDSIAGSLEKILLTIQFSYVTGKTLTARIDAGEQFSALLADLISLSESARTELITLKSAVSGVRTNVVEWRLESQWSKTKEVTGT